MIMMLVKWNSKYKLLDSEIRIKQLRMSNDGKELALYIYNNPEIFKLMKHGSNIYDTEINNLVEFLNKEEHCEYIANAIKTTK